MDDLNKLKIPHGDGGDVELKDYGCESQNVEVVFRNVKKRLINFIEDSEIVLGCVAWLTDLELLNALAKVDTAIVVQKEDFLKPESEINTEKWKRSLRASYDHLSFQYERYAMPGIASELSTSFDPEVAPVRCVGNHNSAKQLAFPRMHNKFLVSCVISHDDSGERYPDIIKPQKVWTGSFNFSQNASNSFENALVISDKKIAVAYAFEFAQIFALSEDLDWESDWVAPELRIGT